MKKKTLLILICAIMLFYAPSVFAKNITGCSSVLPDVTIDAKLPNAVHTIITIIKIAVPVLLVIFGMLDLVKGIIASKEDEIKKGQQIFIKRLIVAVIIFFVTTIVQLIISFATDENDNNIMSCANCFINGAKSDGTCN